MAITATLSTTPSAVIAGQGIGCTLTLSSSPGSTAVQVVSVTPYVTGGSNTGPASAEVGTVNFLPGSSQMLSPSSTAAAALVFNFIANCYAPGLLNPPYPNSPQYSTFTIGAIARLSDGTQATASASVYVYPLIKDNTFANTVLPGNGGLSFFLNTESALMGSLFQP